VKRLFPFLLVAALLAGCGGSGIPGRATLWVTRDRGADVLLVRSVPSGLTVMQALRREADVGTSYGGRFVSSIEGVESDASGRRDWFYFVNGVEADRGASEYRLHPGDVLWWDYRSWQGDDMRAPVVVGAFPEPFLHGYGGKVRPAAVRYESRETRGAALGLANAVRADSVEPMGVPAPADANVLVVVEARVPFTAKLRDGSGSAGSPVLFRISFEDAKRLLRHPDEARRRYQGLP
jgi:hypothetical protein